MKKSLLSLIFILIAFAINAQDKFKNAKKFDKSKATISLDKNLFITKRKNDLLNIDRDENGLPIFIKGKILNQVATRHARGTMESKVFGYLETLKNTIKIAAPQDEFQISTVETDELKQEHIRMNQFYKGIPVYGGEMILHTDGQEVDKMNGRYFPTPTLTNITPKINIENAIHNVKTDITKIARVKTLSPAEQSILKYSNPKSELIIYHENEDFTKEKLAWKIEIRPNFVERWEYFVDAENGNILSKYNHTCVFDGPQTANAIDLNSKTRSIKTYQSGNGYYLIDTSKDMFPAGAVNTEDPQGVLWTIDAGHTTPEDLSVKQVGSSNNNWNNPTAVSAHYNASIAYDYYKKTFNRTSLNGKGGTIISIINITETNEQTNKVQEMDNAFWNGEFMAYGNGNTFFKPLAGGLDVAGHEMTHGVIENTANLNYQGQSGAINESMADVFGVLIDRQDGDFVVGEDVMKNGDPFLRSLSDPNKGGQPASMSQYQNITEDNGGVHINSGIPNRAFYLFTKGLTGTEEQQKAKAEQVYYRALTKYLTRSSKFLDLRAAVVQSCTDLSASVGQDAVAAANAAFNAVGIGSSTTTSTPTQKPVEDLPTNTGNEFLLSYDPCEKAIYSSKEIIASNADYHIVVNDVIIDHKPSVTDDGSFAYYIDKKEVGGGGTLNKVNLTGTPKIEVLDDQVVWSNVAVSKDGKKLALNTIQTVDNDQQNIYIINLETAEFKGFKLYNPTYSSTVKSSGTPLFSDAIEWEYNGEYVIYDAYNQIKSTGLVESNTTTVLDYWDVGLLKAWDAAKNVPGDGIISKIFTNLAKNESIGNPSFAKKSTSVVAFDHILNNKNTILTIDFESKGTDGSYKRSELANNIVGYPEFSAKDDKLIFNKLVNKNTAKCAIDTTNTVSINLTSDKVTTTGIINPDFIITSSLAVWYTVGKRELPTKATQIINFSITDKTEGPATTIDLATVTDKGNPISYKVISGPATIVNGKLQLTGKPGKVKVQADAASNTTTNSAQTIAEFCVNPTKPIITITTGTDQYIFSSSASAGNNWYKNGIAINELGTAINVVSTSSFTVQVVIEGCKSEFSDAKSASKEIVLAEEELSKAGISVYPNPVTDKLNLKFNNIQINNISIHNILGVSVYNKANYSVIDMNIDMKALPKGLYIITLKTNKGIFYKKLLKE